VRRVIFITCLHSCEILMLNRPELTIEECNVQYVMTCVMPVLYCENYVGR